MLAGDPFVVVLHAYIGGCRGSARFAALADLGGTFCHLHHLLLRRVLHRPQLAVAIHIVLAIQRVGEEIGEISVFVQIVIDATTAIQLRRSRASVGSDRLHFARTSDAIEGIHCIIVVRGRGNTRRGESGVGGHGVLLFQGELSN